MKSGIPKEKPAIYVNQVCGSGIRSVASGFQSIKAGDSKIIIAEVKKVCLWPSCHTSTRWKKIR